MFRSTGIGKLREFQGEGLVRLAASAQLIVIGVATGHGRLNQEMYQSVMLQVVADA
jgi:hypothetical protein